MVLNRLYPRAGEVDVDDLATRLDLGSRATGERPYVVVNMIASLDGKAGVQGKAGGLGNDADHELFHRLRTQGDAIMVGAGTVRAERYGRPVRSDELTAIRERDGLDPNPPLVIVSGSLNLPSDLPCLQDPEARVICATGVAHDLEGVEADVTYLRVGDDMRLLMALLREQHDIRSVLCEGGPALNGYLFAGGLIDELFLSWAPMIVGGIEPPMTIVAGRVLVEPRDCELLALAERDGALFGRWRIASS